MARVSIIIPVWDRVELTRQCLDSLARTVGSFAETIVVDNGSRDGTQELLRTHPLGVRCSRNAENLGFAVACNQGAVPGRFRAGGENQLDVSRNVARAAS